VVDYKCNYSTFNQGGYSNSNYSLVQCTQCRTAWRTAAKYADDLTQGKLL
jgi:hypothetical protein